MKLHIVTIVLDGEPWLRLQIDNYLKLDLDWHLHIVHGVAANTGSTRWCKPQLPQLSRDGTTELINTLAQNDERFTMHQRMLWKGGKDEMVNTALSHIKEPCVLFVPDADEIFKAPQIEKIVELFDKDPELMHMNFWCRYYLGPNIISISRDGYGNRAVGEWRKAFRFSPGMPMNSHEPIVLNGNRGKFMSRDESARHGLVFDHYAWYHEHQAVSKEKFYGYSGAAEQWRNLQNNTQWPIRDLKAWLNWVGPNASADLLSNHPNFPK